MSPVSAKYVIHASINIEGVVEKPDVIGAVFGQTEGLLGNDLELRELQRSGRIGRIEVNVDVKAGKSTGEIIVPSSLDKAETSIVGAALEVIERIGPCNAHIKVYKIEDIRISKRQHVISRAKELLKNLINTSMPDSQELSDEVAYSVRVMEITEYGKERLPAGPGIEESDEVIIVEGRADVLNLLKHGIKNVIAINGTSVPPIIGEISKKKILTAFVDGDRGGKLIVKELLGVADIDFVAFAPDGKEVEEITKKEIHQSLRGKVSAEQIKLDLNRIKNKPTNLRKRSGNFEKPRPRAPQRTQYEQSRPKKVIRVSSKEAKRFKETLENLVGTKGACLLDENLKILGKVPVSELESTIKSLKTGVHSIILDGEVEKKLINSAHSSSIKFIVGMNSKVKDSRICILTNKDL